MGLHIEIPENLRQEIEARVRHGEFHDATALVSEAVRYYLQRHTQADWDEYVRQEVGWSCRHSGV